MSEEWSDISGFEGHYRVSSLGRVMSLKTGEYELKPMKKTGETKPRLRVVLWLNGTAHPKHIHRLVADAFIPNPRGLPLVRHLNDNPSDNRVENLRWGTQTDNMRDMIRNSGHYESRRTHCPQGHEYDEENTRITSRGTRSCKACKRIRNKKLLKEREGREPPRHGLNSIYCNWGCRCDRCKLAHREYMHDWKARKDEKAMIGEE